MADTVTVGSSFASDIRIEAPEPKRGEARGLDTVINGASSAREGITSGVAIKTLRAWVRDNSDHPALAGGLLREVPSEGTVPRSPSIFAVAPPAEPSADAPALKK